MSTRIRDHFRWVELKIRARHGWLVVEYSDELGPRRGRLEQLDFPPSHARIDPSSTVDVRDSTIRYAGIIAPKELGAWVQAGFADISDTRSHYLPQPHTFNRPDIVVPWLLPVLVIPPPGHTAWVWESLIKGMLSHHYQIDDRIVVMRSHKQLPSGPLQLPMRVGSLGFPDPVLFSSLRESSWYQYAPDVQEHGLNVGSDAEDADVVFRLPGITLPARRRPRLVVTIAHPLQWPWLRRLAPPERGMSHLVLLGPGREADIAEIVRQVMHAWVHDFALHELAWIVNRCVRGWAVWVATDAYANQALRLSRVMLALYDQAYFRHPEWRTEANRMAFDFSSESRGLKQLASFLTSPGGAQPRVPVQAPAARKVDVAIFGYSAFGVLAPMRQDRLQSPLKCGWQYRLRVHIGTPTVKTSLMRGDVPGFDSLLPPPDGGTRSIDVVLFVKSFGALSPTRQTIELPPIGESPAVYFLVRAPEAAGIADMRLAFYWENNLVQSFVLRAEVASASADMPYSETPVQVTLASAGIAEFDELGHIAPRALSVALNADATPGKHTLMSKGTGWHAERQLSAPAVQDMVSAYHRILALAGRDGPPPYADLLRRLASEGRKIWNMLTLGDGVDSNQLRSLRTSSGQTLQFVRHSGGSPFPWQIIYDYVLPTGPEFASARICLADTPVSPDWDPSQKGCPHCPDADVICIEGFWSARHRIELLREDLRDGEAPRPRLTLAHAPPANPLISLGIGLQNLQASSAAERLQKLTEAIPDGLVPFTADGGNILDMLWDAQRRPAMLIVIGHLHAAVPEHNLEVRIAPYPSAEDKHMISSAMIAEKKIGTGWPPPHTPLVLLLACDSAQRAPGELISLVDAFLATRASGVAGTEWKIETPQAVDFAAHMVNHMVADCPPKDLGDAVRLFVREQLARESPWPFAFSVYGSAELKVGRS